MSAHEPLSWLTLERYALGELDTATRQRFKVLLTCPAQLAGRARVLVFQAGERFQPLSAQQPPCGNLVPWPGAFALTEQEEVHVCVAWDEARDARKLAQLGEQAVCARLQPAL